MDFFLCFMLARFIFYGIRVYMQDVWEGYFPIPVIKLKETVTIMNKEIMFPFISLIVLSH